MRPWCALTIVQVFGFGVVWVARPDVGADDANAWGRDIDIGGAVVGDRQDRANVCWVVSHRAHDQHARHFGPKHGGPIGDLEGRRWVSF